ncbi:unnamed protein product [Heligmosomoides polygyrus]|uniref:Protein transport protein sec16 n=1 Tax=Heligmosomoides polygyrus TaxID=6339 RepID=A0A183FYQ3_HELPZ|nr:unnamed protein product [Heligmosomoides polygyrus]
MSAELAPESSSSAKMETTASTEHIQGPVATSIDEILHAPEAEAEQQHEDHPADDHTPIQKHDDDGSVGSGSYIERKVEDETAEVKESPVTEEKSLREKRSPSVEAPIQGTEQDAAIGSQLQPADEKPEEHIHHQRDSTTPDAEAVSDARADTSDEEQEQFTRKEAVSPEVSHEPQTPEDDEGHGHDDSMSVKSETRNVIDQDRELDVTTDHVSVLVSPQPSEHVEQRDLASQHGLTDEHDRWDAHHEEHSEAEQQHEAATALTDDYDRWSAHQEQHSEAVQQHGAATAVTDDYGRWDSHQEQHSDAHHDSADHLKDDYDRWAEQQEQHTEAQKEVTNDLSEDYDRWAAQQEQHPEAQQDAANDLNDDYDRWAEQQERHSEAHQDSADHLKDDYDRWAEQQEQHSEVHEDAVDDLKDNHDRWVQHHEEHSAREDAAGDLKDDHDRWVEHQEQHSEVLQEATLRRTDEEHEGHVEHLSDDRKDDGAEVHEYLQASPIQAEYEHQHRGEASAEQLHGHSLSSSGSSSPVRSFPESVTDETEEKTELHHEIHHESATENYPASRGSNNDDHLQRQEENFSNRNEFSGRKDESGSENENENENEERDSFPVNGRQMYRDDSTSYRQVDEKQTSRTTIQDDDSSTDSMVIHDDVEKSSEVLRSPNVTATHSETKDHLDSTPVHGVDDVQKNEDITSHDRHSNEDVVNEGERHPPLERSSGGSRESLHTSNNGHSATPDLRVMTSGDVISSSEAEKSPGSAVVQGEHELDNTRAASETDTRLTGDHASSPSSDVHYPEGGIKSPMQGGYDYSSAHSNENGKDGQVHDVSHTWSEHPLTPEKHTMDDGVMSTDSMVAHDDADSSDADHSGGDFVVHSVTEQSSNNRSMYYHGNGHEADDDTAYGYSRSESETKFSQPEDFEKKSESERHVEEGSTHTHRADFYNWQGESGEITADYGMESKPVPEAHKTPSSKGETMGNDDLYAITSESADIFDQLKPNPNDNMRVLNKGHGVAASDEENNNDDDNSSEGSSDDERTKWALI